MNNPEELSKLRTEMKEVTGKIIHLVHTRMEIAKKIGTVKQNLSIDVEDEKVEKDIKDSIIKLAENLGMDLELSGRLLNLLLLESVRLQNNQVDSQKISPHVAIFMKAKEMEKKGKKIVHLEVGEPDFQPPLSVKKELSKIYRNKNYHYTDILGIPKLRAKIADNVGYGIQPDQVLVTPGGRFAVFCAITSLLKPGDELINIEPTWPAYKECAELIDVKTRTLKTSLKEKWNPNISKLENLVNDNTKMIVINYPNNPTGKILTQNILDQIISLAKDHKLFLLSDEVYSDYSFVDFNSVLQNEYDKKIMISSFSKTFGMTGFRVGYGIANKDIIRKMKGIQATSMTSVAEPMQYCALAAMGNDIKDNVDLIKSRIDLICNRIKKMKMKFLYPDGAMYVYPLIISDLYASDVVLVEKLLENNVAVAPGSGFGSNYKQFIRLSACQPEDVLNKGLDIIENYIQE
ncbi:MAG: aminotransferase class I/II-fold pyridoxal phosphate-dependent enzyme [Nitrososphaeraceae archaeon]|nr:aminotransferase class I/II-fold pyridoxal phosphate-dependent enzyme [Nitrososphaeraceae archaeon]